MKEVFIKTLSMGIVLCILTACTGRPSPSTYSNSSATSSDSNVEADNKNTEPTATGFKNLTRPYYSVLGCGGESGYYETRARDDGSANVTYIDYSSQKEIYLCNAPGCAHDNEGCTSWISAENAGVFPSFQVIIFYLSIAPMAEKRESSHFLELMPHLWMEATVKHLLHLTMGNVLAMCFVPTENPLSAH